MRRYLMLFILCLIVTINMFTQLYAQKLTLKQAVTEVINNNPDLLSCVQNKKAASAEIWDTVSPANPHVFIEYEGIPEANKSLSGYEEKKIGLVQEIEFPLAYYYRFKFQQYEKEAANAKYFIMKNEVIADAKKNYYKVLMLKKQNQLYIEIKRITEELFRKAKIRVEAGESSPYDALKAKVDLAEVENKALAIAKEYKIAIEELAVILGRENSDLLDVDGELEYTSISISLDSLYKVALKYHPLFKKMKADVEQKNIVKKLAWTNLMPDVEVKYFKHEFRGDVISKSWGGEIGLSVPLWFLLKGQGNIRAAKYKLEASKWQAESRKKQIILQVNKAYSKLIVAEKHVQNYQLNTLQEVEELVRIATRSYEEGEMSYLEVTEALRTSNRTKAGYYNALYDCLVAKAELELAIGVY